MKPKLLVAGTVLFCCCAVGLVVWFGRVPPPDAKTLLGLAGIEASNVERIDFAKNRETQQVWRTSDPELIASVLGQYDGMVLSERHEAYAGGYMFFQLHPKIPVDGKSEVMLTLYDSSLYGGGVFPDNTIRSYRVISGGMTQAEWESVLEACERIR